jgi:hypothetical protein
VQLDSHREIAAARLTLANDELTIFYADGGVTSSTQFDPQAANETMSELGLLLGGTSPDGVRHWWR